MCSMDLKLFPMDSQICPLEIESCKSIGVCRRRASLFFSVLFLAASPSAITLNITHAFLSNAMFADETKVVGWLCEYAMNAAILW